MHVKRLHLAQRITKEKTVGIFSRGPSVYESFGYAIQAFGMSVLKLPEEDRIKIQSAACTAIESYMGVQTFESKQKADLLTLYRIISGSVGVKSYEAVDIYAKAKEIDDIIESCIPTNMPMAVMVGPIRMVIEEYITGQKMDDIDYDKFNGSPSRILVEALMSSTSFINTRCMQEPRKHNSTEVLCFSGIASTCAIVAKEHLHKEN